MDVGVSMVSLTNLSTTLIRKLAPYGYHSQQRHTRVVDILMVAYLIARNEWARERAPREDGVTGDTVGGNDLVDDVKLRGWANCSSQSAAAKGHKVQSAAEAGERHLFCDREGGSLGEGDAEPLKFWYVLYLLLPRLVRSGTTRPEHVLRYNTAVCAAGFSDMRKAASRPCIPRQPAAQKRSDRSLVWVQPVTDPTRRYR